MILRLSPVVLSLLLLGAHFFRAGSPELVAVVLALLALLTVRRRWAARVVQVGLVLGAVEWLMTLAQLVFERAYTGAPTFRLAIILLGVALLTALSTLVFSTERLRAVYRPRAAAGVSGR